MNSNAFPTAGIDHVNLVVRDMEAAVDFFTRLLGFEVTLRARLEGAWIDRVTGLAGVLADCVYLQPPAGPRIELLKFIRPEYEERSKPAAGAGEGSGLSAPPNDPGLRHIAFQVADIDAVAARLRAAGVEFISEPIEVPMVNVSAISGRKRLCYFRGPEGVMLELAEYRAQVFRG